MSLFVTVNVLHDCKCHVNSEYGPISRRLPELPQKLYECKQRPSPVNKSVACDRQEFPAVLVVKSASGVWVFNPTW